jgi:DNA-binding NarL/FixJ family response regulator
MKKMKMPKQSNKTRKSKPTEKMVKTVALVKEGYSLKRAMLEAGYSPKTVEKKASEYMKRLDLGELKRGLRIQNAISSNERPCSKLQGIKT